MRRAFGLSDLEDLLKLLDPEIEANLDVLLGNLEKGFTQKHVERLIKGIEKVVRSSPEYKIWCWKKKFGKYECENCGWSVNEGAKLEVHHSPATLYEIVEDKLFQILSGGEDSKGVTLSGVAMDIILMHLRDEVDGMVLCDCCHRKEHRG